MSQIDFLKTIDKRAHQTKKNIEISPGVFVSVYDVSAYETPLNKENLLTDIYDKMYLSHPLTYEQKQIIQSSEDVERGFGYAFTPSGFTVEAPKIGHKPKMTKTKKGIKAKKKR